MMDVLYDVLFGSLILQDKLRYGENVNIIPMFFLPVTIHNNSYSYSLFFWDQMEQYVFLASDVIIKLSSL